MMKKIWIGLLIGVVMLIIGMVFSRIFMFAVPSLEQEYANTQVFRSWEDPLMSLYFLQPFVLGLLLAWVWSMVLPLLKKYGRLQRGFRFALVYWLFSLPGMLMSISSFPISMTMVTTWTINILLQSLAAGLILAKWLDTGNTQVEA
jgi:hypothetical protein